MKRKARFGEQLHEMRQRHDALLGELRHLQGVFKAFEGGHRKPKQERFNGEILEIVSNLATDVRRIREGKALSNLAGVEKQLRRLESEMQFK